MTFNSRLKYKVEHDGVMQFLVKLLMNSLYGAQIRKDIEAEFCCKSEYWMSTEYDERVIGGCQLEIILLNCLKIKV